MGEIWSSLLVFVSTCAAEFWTSCRVFRDLMEQPDYDAIIQPQSSKCVDQFFCIFWRQEDIRNVCIRFNLYLTFYKHSAGFIQVCDTEFQVIALKKKGTVMCLIGCTPTVNNTL